MALAYSPLLNSAKLNCSSEVTLHYWSTEARASRANSTVFPTVPTALRSRSGRVGVEHRLRGFSGSIYCILIFLVVASHRRVQSRRVMSTRVCEKMSCEEFEMIVYICRNSP